MILIRNGTFLTLTEKNVIQKGDLAIKDSLIYYIGPQKEWKDKFDTVIDAKNYIVMPGFVNAHTHLAMTLMRGIADDLPLQKWLFDTIFPIENKLTERDVYFGSLLGIVESIRAGVTTVADFYFRMEKSAQAVKESGIRANLGFGLASKIGTDTLKLKAAEKFINKWQESENGRILASFAPHAPYTCTLQFLKAISNQARKMNVLVQTHLHETKEKVEEFKKKYVITPIEKLDAIGFFNTKVNAAHCIWINDNDINILRNNNVGVTLNPQSNLKIGAGIPLINKMHNAGLTISIGTDGAASNNNLALIEDARLTSFLAKGTSLNPELLNAKELLKMATVNGAKNLGFNDVGLLKEGYKADIILIDTKKPHLTPFTDPYSLVAYSMYPSDVDTVLVDGKIVMKNKEILTVDEDNILKEAETCYKQLRTLTNNKNV
ncbi:MAG: amidohydrolase [Caldisericaceae bacterium]|nr:amidohydrolase [Caldisericaceae bacterium]